ncbi:MAG: hypothetical protein JWM21_857 [Acidobacteria bacterium]|nr:hypothetical protein [Acidobacteriota bacterium]
MTSVKVAQLGLIESPDSGVKILLFLRCLRAHVKTLKLTRYRHPSSPIARKALTSWRKSDRNSPSSTSYSAGSQLQFAPQSRNASGHGFSGNSRWSAGCNLTSTLTVRVVFAASRLNVHFAMLSKYYRGHSEREHRTTFPAKHQMERVSCPYE